MNVQPGINFFSSGSSQSLIGNKSSNPDEGIRETEAFRSMPEICNASF